MSENDEILPFLANSSPYTADLLALPGFEESSYKEVSQQIEVGGEPLRLDELGPMIVNRDGTLRRITNWDTLTTSEKESTMRIVTKRNRERLLVLKKKLGLENGSDGVDDISEDF